MDCAPRKTRDPEKQLKVNGVYRIPHALAQKPGTQPARNELQLLISDLPRPNGIAFSPDEKFLYVNNTEPRKIWMRYRVQPDGTLADAKLFYDATADKRIGGARRHESRFAKAISTAPDQAGSRSCRPNGKLLGTLLIPERVSNVAWGGPGRTTLYITASTQHLSRAPQNPRSPSDPKATAVFSNLSKSCAGTAGLNRYPW